MTEPIPLFPGVSQKETWLEMSDGVSLRVLEFTPPSGDDPQEPVIVFVPGAISPLPLWLEILGVLTPRYSVVYWETREKNSARLPEVRRVDFGMDRFRKDVDEVLRKKVLEDRKHCFVGASFGATVILEHLARAEKSPLTTILIAPNSDFRVPFWLLAPARLIPGRLFSAVKPVLKWYYGKVLLDVESEPEQAARHREMIDSAEPFRLKAAALAMQKYRGWNTFPKITEPVLVVTGKSDTLHSLPKIEKIASVLPDARLQIMASDRETHSAAFGSLVLDAIAAAMSDQRPSDKLVVD